MCASAAVVALCSLVWAASAAVPAASADTPPATDVLLIFDTTGSMTGALSAAKAEIESSMQRIDGDLPSVNYAVAQVRDYASLYGDPGDSPWQVNQPMTGDRASILSAVDALQAEGGGTAPESYARALWEARSDGAVGWRPGAKRVVVLVGDSYPHDNDLDEGIASSDWIVGAPWDTGADPGPDEALGTPDDLDWQSVLTQLGADDMPLMFLFYKGTEALLPYWQSWTGTTGGLVERAGSGQFPADLVYLVERGAGLPPCLDAEDSPPCAEVPPDQARTWKGTRKDVPVDSAAADRLPFQLRVTGTLAASGELLESAAATLSSDPGSTLKVTGPDVPPATLALGTGRLDPPDGFTSSPPSLALGLAWPASPANRGASLPLFTLTSNSDYRRTFAHIQVGTTLNGSLTTSVGSVVAWADAHRWLGRTGRGATLAWWLAQNGNRVPSAYGTPLQFDDLAPLLREFVVRAGQLAGSLNIKHSATRAPGLKASVLSSGRGLRRTMPAWKAQVPPQPIPAGVDAAGLRQELGVLPAARRDLRRGSWRPLRVLASRASASLLAMPLPSQQRPLWLSARRVRPGRTLTVLASGLRGARNLGVTIVGPGYSAEGRLKARAGSAAAKLILPRALSPGNYWVGVLDFSRLDRPGGTVRVASGRFAVTRRGR